MGSTDEQQADTNTLSPRMSLGSTGGKREQILHGALTVFLELGYEGASVDKVAAAAKVGKATIYAYFKDKVGLFGGLIEEICLGISPEGGLALAPGQSTEDFLKAFGEKFLRAADDKEFVALMRLLLGESGRFPELADLYVRQVYLPSVLNVGSALSSSSDLKFEHPQDLAKVFVSALHAQLITGEILGVHRHSSPDRESFLFTLVQMILTTALK